MVIAGTGLRIGTDSLQETLSIVLVVDFADCLVFGQLATNFDLILAKFRGDTRSLEDCSC